MRCLLLFVFAVGVVGVASTTLGQGEFILTMEPVEKSFEFKTKKGILNRGDTKSIDVSIEAPGGYIKNIRFHEQARRNTRDLEFVRTKELWKWTGETYTDNGGASGNFKGHVSAIVVKPAIEYRAVVAQALEGTEGFDIHTTERKAFDAAADNFGTAFFVMSQRLHELGHKAAFATATVDSTKDSWFHCRLEIPPGKFAVVPNPATKYAIGGGKEGERSISFHGVGNMDGSEISIPKNPLRLGALAVLVHQKPLDSKSYQVLDFPPGTGFHIFESKQGARVEFMITDLPNSWGDNYGTCDVAIVKVQ